MVLGAEFGWVSVSPYQNFAVAEEEVEAANSSEDSEPEHKDYNSEVYNGNGQEAFTSGKLTNL